MDTKSKYLLLTFDNGVELLKMGLGEVIKIVTVSGFEAPEYITHTSSIATTDGSILSGKKVGERILDIVFGIDDLENTEVYRKKIQKFFNPKSTIKVTMNWCNSKGVIESEIDSFSWTLIESMWNYLEGNLTLRCPQPYWNDLDNFGKNIAGITAQFTFPLGICTFYRDGTVIPGKKSVGLKTFGGQVTLANKGDAPTGIEIHFIAKRGEVVNPKITLVETGEFIEVFSEMEQGDVVVINTNIGHKKITKNGDNIFKDKNRLSTLFQLKIGDNTIEYNAEENMSNLDVNVYFTPKYLGV